MLTASINEGFKISYRLNKTLKQMTYKKDNENPITNEDTLVRRAWIESAIEGVRARVDATLPPAEAGNLGTEEPAADHDEPHLYLAWDADERCSGT